MTASTNLKTLPVPLAGERQLLIRDLVLDWRIGVHPHEHLAPQRVRLNIVLWFTPDGPVEDRLGNTICYERLIDRLREMATERHTQLVETIAEEICELAFEDPRVDRARITVEKLDVFPEATSVGTQLERQRF